MLAWVCETRLGDVLQISVLILIDVRIFRVHLHVVESTSKPNKIQCSKETAEHLMQLGKGAWVHKRSDSVELKGKGTMETFWVSVRGDRAESVVSAVSGAALPALAAHQPNPTGTTNSRLFDAARATHSERAEGLIEWNCAVLLKLLREIKAVQMSKASAASKSQKVDTAKLEKQFACMPLEEVREIVTLPAFDANSYKQDMDPEEIEIPRKVKGQLRKFVATISKLYRDNAFHNFEHASHVCMVSRCVL